MKELFDDMVNVDFNREDEESILSMVYYQFLLAANLSQKRELLASFLVLVPSISLSLVHLAV